MLGFLNRFGLTPPFNPKAGSALDRIGGVSAGATVQTPTVSASDMGEDDWGIGGASDPSSPSASTSFPSSPSSSSSSSSSSAPSMPGRIDSQIGPAQRDLDAWIAERARTKDFQPKEPSTLRRILAGVVGGAAGYLRGGPAQADPNVVDAATTGVLYGGLRTGGEIGRLNRLQGEGDMLGLRARQERLAMEEARRIAADKERTEDRVLGRRLQEEQIAATRDWRTQMDQDRKRRIQLDYMAQQANLANKGVIDAAAVPRLQGSLDLTPAVTDPNNETGVGVSPTLSAALSRRAVVDQPEPGWNTIKLPMITPSGEVETREMASMTPERAAQLKIETQGEIERDKADARNQRKIDPVIAKALGLPDSYVGQVVDMAGLRMLGDQRLQVLENDAKLRVAGIAANAKTQYAGLANRYMANSLLNARKDYDRQDMELTKLEERGRLAIEKEANDLLEGLNRDLKMMTDEKARAAKEKAIREAADQQKNEMLERMRGLKGELQRRRAEFERRAGQMEGAAGSATGTMAPGAPAAGPRLSPGAVGGGTLDPNAIRERMLRMQ